MASLALNTLLNTFNLSIQWVSDNREILIALLTITQTIAIVVTLIVMAAQLKGAVRATRATIALEFTKSHRDIWINLYVEPKLERILKDDMDLVKKPPTPAEEYFVIMVTNHMASVYDAYKEGLHMIYLKDMKGFFVQRIMKELRLFGCYDILFGKVKEFITNNLFSQRVDLNDANILRNLSELEAVKTIVETFKKEINELTVQDVGDTEIKNYIKVSSARPFVVTDKKYLLPKKSVFNKIVGDSDFELEFADFLERADDVLSFAKNYYEIHFKIDYKNASGAISSYYPDFFVKTDNKTIYIVETKGREDLDDIEKITRLEQWCQDASERQKKINYKMLYVKQEEWDKYKPSSFKQLVETFSKVS